MQKINIGGIERFSLVDYPGQVAAVIFLQGCPWRCPFCYNTELQKIGQNGNHDWNVIFEFLQKRTKALDAVVFSGGEPLVQDSLEEKIKEVKALGYKIGLHTGGYRPEHLKKILPLLDWVGFDIKAPFVEENYQKAVGGANHLNKAQESLQLLLESGINFECRTTCDPRILSVEDIYAIAGELKKRGVKSYHLQKYRPVPSDPLTQDWQCEQFFNNPELTAYLQQSFEDFDLRK